MILAVNSAFAAGGVGGRGETGGKGGTGPGSATGSEGESVAPLGPDEDTQRLFLRKRTENADEAAREAVEKKPWDVSATYSTNRSFIRTDAGSTHFGQSLFGSFGYSFGVHDRVSLSGGAVQGTIIIDPSESGLRATDITLAYSHTFDLPEKFKLSANGSVTAPTSFSSQLASNITAPGASVGLSRAFGDLRLAASIQGRYYLDRYTSAATISDGSTGASSGTGSGAANTKFTAGGALSANYDMPFHRSLSIGVTATDSYRWAYNVGSPPLNSPFYGAEADPTFGTTQPMLQSYGFDVHAAYAMPDFSGIRTRLIVGADNGGADSVLHDGVVHTYFFFRDSSEVYVSLTGTY